jgi:hypothetical protein
MKMYGSNEFAGNLTQGAGVGSEQRYFRADPREQFSFQDDEMSGSLA